MPTLEGKGFQIKNGFWKGLPGKGVGKERVLEKFEKFRENFHAELPALNRPLVREDYIGGGLRREG